MVPVMSIGYDKLKVNHGLLLGLTFEEMTGLLTHDRAKPTHPHTLHGAPAWASLANGLPYLDFDNTHPDWLDCAAIDTADLDFTTGDFSIAIWLAPDNVSVNNYTFMTRGDIFNTGWMLASVGRAFYLDTYQAGTGQVTQSTSVLTADWQLMGVSRSGANVRLYLNRKDVTLFPAGTHIDPATANSELHIGIRDNESTRPFDGRIAGGHCGPRIWGRALSAQEWLQIFETERCLIGV